VLRDLEHARAATSSASFIFRARGDFNGDGVQDIAVFGSANGKHGSWSHTEYMILSPTSDGKLVRLTDRRAPYEVKAIPRAANH
jgi:hypothetical protein